MQANAIPKAPAKIDVYAPPPKPRPNADFNRRLQDIDRPSPRRLSLREDEGSKPTRRGDASKAEPSDEVKPTGREKQSRDDDSAQGRVDDAERGDAQEAQGADQHGQDEDVDNGGETGDAEAEQTADAIQAIAAAVKAVVDQAGAGDKPAAANAQGAASTKTAATTAGGEAQATDLSNAAATSTSSASSQQQTGGEQSGTQANAQQVPNRSQVAQATAKPATPIQIDATLGAVQQTSGAAAAAQQLPVAAPPSAETAQSAALSNLEKSPDDPNAARIARGVQSAISQRGGTVRLRLTPPELGTVRIQLDMKDGVVRANLTAQSDSVRTLLNHQIGNLRHALEGQGLVVERLTVQVGDNQGQATLSDDGSSRQSQADGRSRGQYARQHDGGEQSSTDEAFEDQLADQAA